MRMISTRTIGALVALFLLTVSLAAVAWFTQDKQAAALEALYTKHVVAVRNLKVISDRYAVDVVDAAHKVRNGNFTREQAYKAMKVALAEIDALWAQFQEAHQNDSLGEKAKAGEAKLKAAHNATIALIDMLERADNRSLNQFVVREMYAAIDPATELLGGMIEAELELGKATAVDAIESGRNSRFILLGVSLAAILLCASAAYYINFGVVRPLKRSIGTMDTLAQSTIGDGAGAQAALAQLETIEIGGLTRQDELGDLSRSMETFKQAAIERQRLRIANEEETQARLARSTRVEALIGEFEAKAAGIVATVATASTELEATARTMLQVAESTATESENSTSQTANTSHNLKLLSETGEELTSSIAEIGRQAKESSNFAGVASARATQTDSTVRKLDEAGKAIVEVVDLIRSIAGQTNLLALNATIEAARAGEAGRGFAVVASEVKELASQTTRATEIIAEHVGSIREASQDSIAAMSEIVAMIQEINQVASTIANAVDQQGVATQGIQQHVSMVSQGTQTALESLAVVSEGATNTGAAASQVLSASEELARQSSAIRQEIDAFLREVRAA